MRTPASRKAGMSGVALPKPELVPFPVVPFELLVAVLTGPVVVAVRVWSAICTGVFSSIQNSLGGYKVK